MIGNKKVVQKAFCILLLSLAVTSSLRNVYAYEPHTIFRIDPKINTEFVIPDIPQERLAPKDNVDKQYAKIEDSVYNPVDKFEETLIHSLEG